jgi:hypothetical protein
MSNLSPSKLDSSPLLAKQTPLSPNQPSPPPNQPPKFSVPILAPPHLIATSTITPLTHSRPYSTLAYPVENSIHELSITNIIATARVHSGNVTNLVSHTSTTVESSRVQTESIDVAIADDILIKKPLSIAPFSPTSEIQKRVLENTLSTVSTQLREVSKLQPTQTTQQPKHLLNLIGILPPSTVMCDKWWWYKTV